MALWLGKHKTGFGLALIAGVVMLAFFPALRVSFVGDDWIFYELVGRLSLSDYLVKYFDPRIQTAWYRPVQGILFWLGYQFFGSDQMWYHLVNVLFHLANSVALMLVVRRALGRWTVAFLAGLLFATFPLPVEGTFKPGVIDPVTTLFYLIAIWFWLGYLSGRFRDYWLAFAAFTIALLSKEIAVTLPVVLFLLDRCFVARPATLKQLAARYAIFVLAWVAYLPIEYIVVTRSVFVSHEGYQPSLRLFNNLVDYLCGLAFPWGFYPVLSHIWLVLVALLLGYAILIKRAWGLVPVIAGAILGILPIVFFPEVSFRFDYLSMTGSALLFALAFEGVLRRAGGAYRIGRALPLAVVALFVLGGAVQINAAAAAFGEFGRVSRVTFRNVRQAHPALPPDTLLYFIDPPLPGPSLSGMLFWYYGSGVTSLATDSSHVAGLREHAAAFVYYFDADGSQKEIYVRKEMTARAAPSLPLDLGGTVRLEGFELANSRVQAGEPIVLFLYWRGLKRMDADYLLTVRLVGPSGTVAAYQQSPRRGRAPTSSWTVGDLVVDALVLPVQAPAGSYRLEVEMSDPATGQALAAADASAGRILIEPVSISE